MEISPIYHNSRPEGELPAQEAAAFDFLDSLGIDYDRVTHELADTMEKCDDVSAVLGVDVCKNLFLCNRQKTSFYLLMMPGEKVFKTKDLSKQLGVARLSFASPEDMLRLLNITPGPPVVRAGRAALGLAALHAGVSDDPRIDERRRKPRAAAHRQGDL